MNERPLGANLIAIGLASIAFAMLLVIVMTGSIKDSEIGFIVEKLRHVDENPDSETVFVRIKDGDRWFFRKRDESDLTKFTEDEIRRVAEEIQRKERSLNVILMVSRNSESGIMIETMDVLRSVGFYNIQVSSID